MGASGNKKGDHVIALFDLSKLLSQQPTAEVPPEQCVHQQ